MTPFAFYNQSFGGAAGGVYGASGWPQKQATLLGTVIAGSNDAFAFYGIHETSRSPSSPTVSFWTRTSP